MNFNKNSVQLKRRMNRRSLLSFYKRRALKGDNTRLSNETMYSESHISNVKGGRRESVEILDAMYYISRRRVAQY